MALRSRNHYHPNHIFSTILMYCALLVPLSSFAWNDIGHRLVAAIAYQNLNSTARKNVDTLMLYFSREYPFVKSFTELAFWPDSLRRQRINTFAHWHYIDSPFSKDGSPLVDTVKTQNVVWAIPNVQMVVANYRANPYERVRFLGFLTHFVGDIHQPLHTATLISAKHPTGDRGGNLYKIKVGGRKIKLHEFWDGGAGNYVKVSREKIDEIAKKIMLSHPKDHFIERLQDKDVNHWSMEGAELAKKMVYDTAEDDAVSNEYIEEAKLVVDQQIALAGYRLADMLNQTLGAQQINKPRGRRTVQAEKIY